VLYIFDLCSPKSFFYPPKTLGFFFSSFGLMCLEKLYISSSFESIVVSLFSFVFQTSNNNKNSCILDKTKMFEFVNSNEILEGCILVIIVISLYMMISTSSFTLYINYCLVHVYFSFIILCSMSRILKANNG
jgi:hypothetical protein